MMTDGIIPLERVLFGHDYWRSYRAIDKIEVYCDLVDHLEKKIDGVEARGKDETVTLLNVQVVMSSYAIESAIKSFWALDYP